MIQRVFDWIDQPARRRTPLYDLAMDNRIYLAVVALAVVAGVLFGIYG